MTLPPKAPREVIAPGAWLGLLGGGQLGRMFCMAAQSMGYRVAVLDPGDESPAGIGRRPAHPRRTTSTDTALAALAELVEAATTEFENVPAASLEFLGRSARVTPSADSVAIAQDRIREKRFLASIGFAVAPFAVLATDADARAIDPALRAGHRQERALRLRRQRPDSRRQRGRRPGGVRRDGRRPVRARTAGPADAARCRSSSRATTAATR